MEFILTGEPASGAELERLGVVNKVFASSEVVLEAMKLAEKIAVMSGPVIKIAKQAVLTGRHPKNDSRY
jgi:enoyl-CoA hydratase